ncbi:MAG TPA: hypothetical protein VMF61_16380 [Candidatus Acidoferrales bacterium]|nr:hypothetical protein [Candidatus Acidoferrales bacterium]
MNARRPLVADLAILRLALRGLRAVGAPPKPTPLTYGGESFLPAIVAIVVLAAIPDALVRHLLVPRAYLAWNLVADAAVVAGVAWICGLYGSMAELPHRVDDEAIELHLGLAASASCAPSNLRSAEAIGRIKRVQLRRRDPCAGVLTAPGSAAVRVDFVEPVALLTYPYVFDRQVTAVYVAADRPAELAAALEGARDRALASG